MIELTPGDFQYADVRVRTLRGGAHEGGYKGLDRGIEVVLKDALEVPRV